MNPKTRTDPAITFRRAIVELYKALHAAGVLHNDVTTRHVLRRPSGGEEPGSLALIDFDQAVILDEDEAEHGGLVRREMAEVRRMLGGGELGE